MGLGRWIVGGLCAAGAVIAAPIVLPIAAVGAATAGAAAAGAAGVAAAAGAAATGAVATVGGALVGSAVGATAIGAMTTVGSAVGVAASTVGITSVATASATAVGTIATTGVIGVATAVSGASKMSDAKGIVETANCKYETKKEELDIYEKKGNETLADLGKLKLEIWESFKAFHESISKIKKCKLIGAGCEQEAFHLSKEELDGIGAISITACDILATSANSIGTGLLTGIAAYSGTMTFGVASTGTAIGTLSGVAATNATLAALGGGSLACGGLGVAGGTCVLGGLIAAPALAVSGILLSLKGSDALNKAREFETQSRNAVNKCNESIRFIQDIDILVLELTKSITNVYCLYSEKIIKLNDTLERTTDFNAFTYDEQKSTELLILSVKCLKKLTTVNLIKKEANKEEINGDVEKTMTETGVLLAESCGVHSTQSLN